jgi:hypothetical protein
MISRSPGHASSMPRRRGMARAPGGVPAAAASAGRAPRSDEGAPALGGRRCAVREPLSPRHLGLCARRSNQGCEVFAIPVFAATSARPAVSWRSDSMRSTTGSENPSSASAAADRASFCSRISSIGTPARRRQRQPTRGQQRSGRLSVFGSSPGDCFTSGLPRGGLTGSQAIGCPLSGEGHFPERRRMSWRSTYDSEPVPCVRIRWRERDFRDKSGTHFVPCP